MCVIVLLILSLSLDFLLKYVISFKLLTLQIQGEEREVILFSTLLAPRHATKTTTSKPNNKSKSSSKKDDSESDESDDGFDPLESLEEVNTNSDGEDSDEDNNFNSHKRAAPVRALGLSYSTLAHAHGERLLNVRY